MNKLEIAFINVFSPYKVWYKGEILFFETDNGCGYSIDFEVVEHPIFKAYWFSLTNLDQTTSHHDVKIMQTVFACNSCAKSTETSIFRIKGLCHASVP